MRKPSPVKKFAEHSSLMRTVYCVMFCHLTSVRYFLSSDPSLLWLCDCLSGHGRHLVSGRGADPPDCYASQPSPSLRLAIATRTTCTQERKQSCEVLRSYTDLLLYMDVALSQSHFRSAMRSLATAAASKAGSPLVALAVLLQRRALAASTPRVATPSPTVAASSGTLLHEGAAAGA